MTVVCKVLLYIYYSGEARKCPFDFETVLVLNEQQWHQPKHYEISFNNQICLHKFITRKSYVRLHSRKRFYVAKYFDPFSTRRI